jgi:anti-sigma-K factor RskA
VKLLLRHELHTLTGAYALDAVDDAERDRFEHHLNRCQSCSHEVRGLRETATRMALAVARVPPAQLRERVMAAAARTRQLPPVTEQRPLPKARSVWFPRLAVGLAAVAVAAAVALGIALSSAQRQLDNARAREQAVAGVLTPGARILTARISHGGTATVVVSRGKRELLFTAKGLPALPGRKVYQLWLIGIRATRSAGLVSVASGRAAPVLASGLLRGDRLGLTVEPAGGTSQPTTTPLIALPVFS